MKIAHTIIQAISRAPGPNGWQHCERKVKGIVPFSTGTNSTVTVGGHTTHVNYTNFAIETVGNVRISVMRVVLAGINFQTEEESLAWYIQAKKEGWS